MSIRLKQIKLDTLEETTRLIELIIKKVNEQELSNEQVAELIKSILKVYDLVLDRKELEEILDIFLQD